MVQFGCCKSELWWAITDNEEKKIINWITIIDCSIPIPCIFSFGWFHFQRTLFLSIYVDLILFNFFLCLFQTFLEMGSQILVTFFSLYKFKKSFWSWKNNHFLGFVRFESLFWLLASEHFVSVIRYPFSSIFVMSMFLTVITCLNVFVTQKKKN